METKTETVALLLVATVAATSGAVASLRSSPLISIHFRVSAISVAPYQDCAYLLLLPELVVAVVVFVIGVEL